jgi:surface antigen
MENRTSHLKNFGIYLLSVSLCFLAAAIGYFGYQVAMIRSELPAILETVDQTSGKIEPVLKEIRQIQAIIPPIIEEVGKVRALVPDVLHEVAATREQIPPILKEVEATRNAIPPILAEVGKTRKEIPAVLKTVDNASSAVNNTAEEIEALRPMIPEVLAEMEATRNAIDPALDRVDQLITKAETVGQKTTEGAISGVVTGVVKSPFSILGGFGESLGTALTGTSELTDEDTKVAMQTLSTLVKKPEGTTMDWDNPATKASGTLTLLDSYTSAGKNCIKIESKASKQGKRLAPQQVDLCEDKDNNWKIVK